MAKGEMIVGLDIGTTKICGIIAEVDQGGDLKIIGVGNSSSDGLRRGVVVNVDKTVHSIEKAVREAELMAGVKVSSAYVGIAGDHIRSFNSRGVVAVTGNDNEITQTDVNRVIDHAKAIAIPIDREIIHVVPQEFIVDDQSGVEDPVGISGIRLEAEVHIVTGAVASVQNIVKSVRRAGIEVMDVVLEPLASSCAVLSEDEKEIGVGVLDVGGGTTDIAIFFDGGIRHTSVIGLGGQNVTNDIAIGLRTAWGQAEEIKREYGCASLDEVENGETINVPGIGGRPPHEVPGVELVSIIEPRMQEIFTLALEDIKKNWNYTNVLASGIVLTGGGSMLKGSLELASKVFDMPTRQGVPQRITGLVDEVKSPMYSTGVGLVLYGFENLGREGAMVGVRGDRLFDAIFVRMKEWLKEFF